MSTDVVISQVYGGGGNAGATLTQRLHRAVQPRHDAGQPRRLVGAVQLGDRRPARGQVTPLTGSIAPGGYYLVQQARGQRPARAAAGAGRDRHDRDGGRRPARSRCRRRRRAFAGACPAGGDRRPRRLRRRQLLRRRWRRRPLTSNTTAALRKRGGCFDSDNNNVDFSIGAPTPRNSASPARAARPRPAAIHDIQGSGLSSPLPVTTSSRPASSPA